MRSRNANHLAVVQPAGPPLLGQSPAMKSVLRLIERVARSDAAVLITGESGTGKELVARAIHSASARSAGAFVAVNAGGVAEGTFESELFGHTKGAFTDARFDRAGAFESAAGGTIFLDEIGNMPLSQQAKLLRVLQTGEYTAVGESRPKLADVRVLAATNTVLRSAIARGAFREDLYYRLDTVVIDLPPLRQRAGEVQLLAGYFLQRERRGLRFSAAAREALDRHSWPGNVRELEHAVQRAAILCCGDEIGEADLALRQAEQDLEEMTLDGAVGQLIERAVRRCGGNVGEAAARLGISRSALYRRIALSRRA
jgi:DNA-binding NtrC family response regulator